MMINLRAGIVVGTLTLISEFCKITPSGKKEVYWVCECQCRRECQRSAKVLRREVKRGQHNCGCAQPQPKMKQRVPVDDPEEIERRKQEIFASWTPEQRENRKVGVVQKPYEIPTVQTSSHIDKTGEFR